MKTVPPDTHPTSRDHSLINMAVVAVLIATLLALPFLAHTRRGSRDSVPATSVSRQ